jgi:hypothetical protein
MERRSKKAKQEPVFIIKPALKHGGLDYLHISLIALVIILIALAFSLSYFKQGTIIKNCAYGIVNGTCSQPQYNSSQALGAAEKILAGYAYINTPISVLPYYSEPNKANVSYIQSQNVWLVKIPYMNPLANSSTYYFSMLLSGSNLSLIQSFYQNTVAPEATNNSVAAFGAVQIYGKQFCQTSAPISVYLLTDPYAPGAFSAISQAANLSTKYGNRLNVSYKFIFTGYATNWYPGYGVNETQLLGKYLFCSAAQNGMQAYSANVSKIYAGRPLPNETLYNTAVGSGLNVQELNSCIANSTSTLDAQALLAKFYGVATTPQYVVDCRYSAIPETVTSAINYTLQQLNQTG